MIFLTTGGSNCAFGGLVLLTPLVRCNSETFLCSALTRRGNSLLFLSLSIPASLITRCSPVGSILNSTDFGGRLFIFPCLVKALKRAGDDSVLASEVQRPECKMPTFAHACIPSTGKMGDWRVLGDSCQPSLNYELLASERPRLTRAYTGLDLMGDQC